MDNDEPKLHIDSDKPKVRYYNEYQLEDRVRTARAEALRLAADRAVEWMNKDHYFDPPEPFDNLRAAILDEKQEA